MKRTSKIVLAVFVALVIAVVPLYYYTRPPAASEEAAIQVWGAVSNPANITMAQLKEYAPTTIEVTLTSSSRPQDNGVFAYTGVMLKTLLENAQTSGDAASVYVQASDGYGTTLSLQDALNPTTIIAYQRNGTDLTPLKENGEGPLRLIIGSDQFAQRWVRGVAAIEVS